MEQSKKKKYMFIAGPLVIFIALIGLTYAFFNYTRTGQANTLGTGRIYFNTTQGEALTLTNIFPMTATEASNANLDSVTVGIVGDTTYTNGEEYEISLVDVTNTINGKTIPINYIATYTAATGGTIGTSNSNYWEDREDKNASIYLLNSTGQVKENAKVLVGYIDNGATGISGTLTISAYIDADRIAISDTYYENVSATPTPTGPNDQYGTTSEWVNGRTVLTTGEWNSLSSNPISFKIKAESNEGIWVEAPLTLYTQIVKSVSPPTTINFADPSSNYNGMGLFILPGTTSDIHPIYYYRGSVTNNNVIFGGFCWQIVRTTDTGGIKMIYNGVLTNNGTTCTNTFHADRILSIGNSVYNSSKQSVSDVGYMGNARYPRDNTSTVTGQIFGKSVEWNGTNYLVIESTSGSPSTNTTKDDFHHYSCGSAGVTSCSTVRYYYYSSYYIILSSGDTIEDALYKMTGTGSQATKNKNAGYNLNVNDSAIKGEIDTWFRTNLTNEVDSNNPNYSIYIEDTIYCNDRSFKTIGTDNTYIQGGWNPNGGSVSSYSLTFGTSNRVDNDWYSTTNAPIVKNTGEIPNVLCPNETDRFTVSGSIGNGALTYPVGLLTADEAIMGGAGGEDYSSNGQLYLYTGGYYWTLSPFNFIDGDATQFVVGLGGGVTNNSLTYAVGIRPVISLKPGIEYESGGDGTTTHPYVIKYN